MKLVIPMAGRGTRVRPHSHVTPKPLLKVCGRNIIERLVDTFGTVFPGQLTEGVFVLGPDFGADIREQLTAICAERNMKANFAVQETAQGTAHAVYCAKDYLQGNGIVVFADTLFEMAPNLDLGDSDVVAWIKEVEDPRRFGVAVRRGDKIVEFVEKPSEPISNEALIGIYYVKELSVLRDSIKSLIDDDFRGHGGEFQLTDAFDRLLKSGMHFTTAGVTEWLDCGTIPALMDTTQLIIAKNPGSTGAKIENSVINEPVFIAEGAVVTNSIVGPNVSIEEGAVVDDAELKNTIVFAHAEVSGSKLDESLVGQNASVIGYKGKLNIGDHSTVGQE